MRFTESEVRAAYRTSVINLARQYGYEMEFQKTAWKIKHMGGLFIWADGLGYYHHATGDKGSNVDFLCKYCGAASKGDAIEMLLSDAHITPSAIQAAKVTEKKEFKLPEMNKGRGNFNRIIAYLSQTRHIDKEIIYQMIHEKKLYEDIRHNCVFVGYDKNGKARYAAQRGTATIPGRSPFKGDVSGSEKYPFVIKGRPDCKRVFVFEAPIEAMSHASIYKAGGLDHQADHRISQGGLSSKALYIFLESNPQIDEVILCLNNDYDAVDPNTGKSANWGQIATLNIAKELASKGFKVYKQLPQLPYRDWNEQLCGSFAPEAVQNNADLTPPEHGEEAAEL